MTSVLNKYPTLCHFIIGSFPLLLILGIINFNFTNEVDAISWFKAHTQAHPDLESVAKVVTNFGNAVFYPIYLWFLITGIRMRKTSKSRLKFALVFLAVQLTVSLVLVRFLKIAIGKPRPDEGGLFQPFSTKGVHHSMPSGHTTEIYGASMPLVFRYRQLLLTFTLGSFAAAVAFSRIYLGWHYPSDVLCGWMIGSAAGLATHLLSQED